MQTMYKIMLLCGVLMSTTSAFAQYYDHVIGVRGGTSVELSYKRFVAYYPSIQQAVEGLIGFQFDERRRSQNGYIIEGLYHLQKALPEMGGMVVFSLIVTPWSMRRRNLLLPFLAHLLIELENLAFMFLT